MGYKVVPEKINSVIGASLKKIFQG